MTGYLYTLDLEKLAEDDIPLAHLVENRPIIPERWGWTTHVITLKMPDFDGELLAKLILEEIKSQISERKRLIQSTETWNFFTTSKTGGSKTKLWTKAVQ